MRSSSGLERVRALTFVALFLLTGSLMHPDGSLQHSTGIALGETHMHPMSVSSGVGWSRGARTSGVPGLFSHGLASGVGSVVYTIDLLNNSLHSGNYRFTSCGSPMYATSVPSLNELFVSCENNVVEVLNLATMLAVASIPVGSSPEEMAFDSVKGELFVANDLSNNVSVINATTNSVVASIKVGQSPWGLAYDAGLGEVFVTNAATVMAISDTKNAVTATISTGSTSSPSGIAFDPNTGDLYAADFGDDNLSIISSTNNTVMKTLYLGPGSAPQDVAYDNATGEVYVSDSGTDNVSVIATATNTVSAIIPVGFSPWGVAYDSAKGTLFVANDLSDNVSVLSDTTHRVSATIKVGTAPSGVTFDSRNGLVYVANLYTIGVISGNNSSIVAIRPVGTGPTGIEFDSTTGDVYVANRGSDNVSVISGTTNQVTTSISKGVSSPFGETFDTGRGNLYVANSGTGNVSVISSTTDQVIATIPLGVSSPFGIAYDGANGNVYVADHGSNSVSVIASATNKVVATIPLGVSSPFGITYDPSNGNMYVSDSASDKVTVISGATDRVVANVSLGVSSPFGIVYDGSDGDVYVADSASNNVTVISGVTNRVLTNVSLGVSSPFGIAYDGANGAVYVADSATNNVSVLWGTALVGSIAVGVRPAFLIYDTVNGYLYVTDSLGSAVSIIPNVDLGTPLASVSVLPANATVYVGDTVYPLTAVPECLGGSCLPGSIYTWNISDPSLGVLGSFSGNPVSFTAGGSPGIVDISVTASLNGKSATSPPVPITIETKPSVSVLTSVTVGPSSPSVATGASVVFTATPACSAVCPSGTTFHWTLDNALGRLSSNGGSNVTFFAGTVAGQVSLTVVATFANVSQSASALIKITNVPNPGGGSVGTGLSTREIAYIATGVGLAILTVGLGLFYRFGRRRSGGPNRSLSTGSNKPAELPERPSRRFSGDSVDSD